MSIAEALSSRVRNRATVKVKKPKRLKDQKGCYCLTDVIFQVPLIDKLAPVQKKPLLPPTILGALGYLSIAGRRVDLCAAELYVQIRL